MHATPHALQLLLGAGASSSRRWLDWREFMQLAGALLAFQAAGGAGVAEPPYVLLLISELHLAEKPSTDGPYFLAARPAASLTDEPVPAVSCSLRLC